MPWIALLILAFPACLFGQEREVLFRGEMGSRREARTPVFDFKAGQTMTCRPVPPRSGAPPAIVTFVYDQDKHLVGRSNEDAARAPFDWSVPRSGRFYAVVRNLSETPGQFELSVQQLQPTSPAAPAPPKNLGVVRVFYATNRVLESPRPVRFGKEPAPNATPLLGYSDVSIPRDHRIGELEGPSVFSLLLGRTPDAAKHVAVQSIVQQDAALFFQRIANRAAGSTNREAFVFIHGFAVSFEDALRRTAQISYDLAFDGPAIAFSWPTQEGLSPFAYNRDGRNSELSADVLKGFLEQLSLHGGLDQIHLIAHSMGNRVLARAIQQVAGAAVKPATKLREIVLMAPDIDAALFRQLSAHMRSAAARVTLYASSKDAALVLSRAYAGYSRAGQGGQDVVVVKGVDTIDASAVDTSLLGLFHSYYADNSTILSDIYQLLRGAPVPRFRLRQAQHRDGPYWLFQPAAR